MGYVLHISIYYIAYGRLSKHALQRKKPSVKIMYVSLSANDLVSLPNPQDRYSSNSAWEIFTKRCHRIAIFSHIEPW
jgi:hypothetical protein